MVGVVTFEPKTSLSLKKIRDNRKLLIPLRCSEIVSK